MNKSASQWPPIDPAKNEPPQNDLASPESSRSSMMPAGLPSGAKAEAGAEAGVSELGAMGRELGAARTAKGLSLSEVAGRLRIRRIYLEALEAGRYQDLPAAAYALGFIRSYAALVGMDKNEAVERYKREMAGRPRTPQLQMPQPITEQRLPSAMLVIASLLALMVLYGLWLLIADPGREIADAPQALPPIVAPAPVMAPAANPASPFALSPEQAAGASSSETAETAPVLAPSSSSSASTSSVAVATPSIVAATSPSPSPSSSSSAVTKPAKPAAVTTTQAVAATLAPSATPSATTLATTSATTSAVGAPVGASVGASVGVAVGTPVAGAPVSAALPAAPSRVVIAAQADSWIELRTTSGQLLESRLMEAGESLRPPNRPDLRLTVGNAGGVLILMDNRPLPKLGAPGEIVRNIHLDPAEWGLPAGTGKTGAPGPATSPATGPASEKLAPRPASAINR